MQGRDHLRRMETLCSTYAFARHGETLLPHARRAPNHHMTGIMPDISIFLTFTAVLKGRHVERGNPSADPNEDHRTWEKSALRVGKPAVHVHPQGIRTRHPETRVQ